MEESLGKGKRYLFRLKTLHLNSFPATRIGVVEKELRDIIGMFEKWADGLELQHDVFLSVHLTDNMGECVEKVRRAYGRKCETRYNPGRNAVVAQGITLFHPTYPPLEVSIIFDQNSWTIDSNDSIVSRVYMVPHEIEHVLQRAREMNPALGTYDGPAKTEGEQMKRVARILRDEFEADKVAVSICNGILRNERGESVSPGEVMGPWFLDAARDLLGKIRDFVWDVQAYRCTGIGLNALHEKAGSLIGEFLLVLVHAVPLYGQMDKMDLLRVGLQEIPGFSVYLGEDYDALLDALVMKDSGAAEAETIRICVSILNRVGLRVEDLPEGIYVHVHEPLIC